MQAQESLVASSRLAACSRHTTNRHKKLKRRVSKQNSKKVVLAQVECPREEEITPLKASVEQKSTQSSNSVKAQLLEVKVRAFASSSVLQFEDSVSFELIEASWTEGRTLHRASAKPLADRRTVLVDWIMEAAARTSLSLRTLVTAVGIVDHSLTRDCSTIANWRLLGATALLMAAKMEESRAFPIRCLVDAFAPQVTPQALVANEAVILRLLDYQLVRSSVLQRALTLKVGNGRAKTAEEDTEFYYLLFRCLLDERVCKFSDSVLAATLVFLSQAMRLKSNIQIEATQFEDIELFKCLETMCTRRSEGKSDHHASLCRLFSRKIHEFESLLEKIVFF